MRVKYITVKQQIGAKNISMTAQLEKNERVSTATQTLIDIVSRECRACHEKGL